MKTIFLFFIIAVVAIAIFIIIRKQIQKKDPRKVWGKIYKEWFDLEKDFSNLKIPKHYNSKKHFLVIVAQGVAINHVFSAIRKKFEVYLYAEDLNYNVKQNDRTAEGGDYIVLFKRNIEADEEFKNLSANQLKTAGHKGITLTERLLLEVLYFTKTKKHLDIVNWTLCSGSHDADGRVPHVSWNSDYDELYVDWYYPAYSYDLLRSRAVVS